jgi:hypothetical protein
VSARRRHRSLVGQPFAVTESDVCPRACGGFLVRRQDGKPGRRCGACGAPERIASVRLNLPDGGHEDVDLAELRRAVLGAM